MSRLNKTLVTTLPPIIKKSTYDSESINAGILHFGLGAFHRGHQAWFTEQVLNQEGGHWAISAVSLRNTQLRDDLAQQDNLYSVVTRENNVWEIQLVSAIKEVLVARETPEQVIDKIADHGIHVITLTITEKGYCHQPASGDLDMDNADIQNDIENYFDADTAPSTAIGYLAAGLKQRMQNEGGPITLVSCDNLPHNGQVLGTVLRQFAAKVDSELALWLDTNVCFPSSMVDRIVPSVTPEDIAALTAKAAYQDQAAVFTEPFAQWVIEDNFAGLMPNWQAAGALYVKDVKPFEEMKLRLLNGSHSIIAYLGYLAGYDYVHQVMADTDFKAFIRRYMAEVIQPTLLLPADFNVPAYIDSLCARFANSALNHQTRQISQDGSKKIPPRWIAPLPQLIEKNISTKMSALILASWIHYLGGQRDNGETFSIEDPMTELFTTTLKQELNQKSGQGTCRAILSINSIFGDLAEQQTTFLQQVEHCYQIVQEQGIQNTLHNFLQEQ